MEAGTGDIKGPVDQILGGWEMIWVEDPWTGKRDIVRVPREEADYWRRMGLSQHPYWGESEAQEWRRRLREEKEAVSREERECRAWRLEEARKRGYLMDPGLLYDKRRMPMGRRAEMMRPLRF